LRRSLREECATKIVVRNGLALDWIKTDFKNLVESFGDGDKLRLDHMVKFRCCWCDLNEAEGIKCSDSMTHCAGLLDLVEGENNSSMLQIRECNVSQLKCSLCDIVSSNFVAIQRKLPRPKCTSCLREVLAPMNSPFFKCRKCGDITMETLEIGLCTPCQLTRQQKDKPIFSCDQSEEDYYHEDDDSEEEQKTEGCAKIEARCPVCRSWFPSAEFELSRSTICMVCLFKVYDNPERP